MQDSMTLTEHAQQARRVHEMKEAITDMFQALIVYSNTSRVARQRTATAVAINKMQGELEKAFNREYPETADKVGRPHYDPDHLELLEQEAGRN